MNDAGLNLMKLLELQLVENIILKKAVEINSLKKSKPLAKLLYQFEEIKETYDSKAKKLSALENERKKIEDTINLQNDKIKKNEEKLYSGTITNAKELLNYQEEIKQLKSSNDNLESKEIEAMFEIDELRPGYIKLKEKKDALENEINALKKEIKEEIGKIESQITKLKDRGKKAAHGIPRELLLKYDDIKHKRGGVAVALMKGNICNTCSMELPVGELDKMKDANKLYKCPNCSRMLIIYRDEAEEIKKSLDELL